jgi:NAD(P)H-dependent flavin oxidoreductase YrpB (nitropropane dioxygenase family)
MSGCTAHVCFGGKADMVFSGISLSRRERDRLRAQTVSTTQAGRQHECILWAGQTAGGIKEVLPVATIMHQLIEEAEAALAQAQDLVKMTGSRAAAE